MLLQSQGSTIEILPALPSALPDGDVKGICARGGFVLSFKWDKGQLQNVEVTSNNGGVCKLRYHDKVIIINTQKNKTYHFDSFLKRV
jgi:alpha-L-fucosidase 2